MDDTKIAIIGAGGQLGRALQIRYPKALAIDRGELDITDWEAVRAFDWSAITTIVNAAAFTNVDGAETPEGRRAAWQINALGVANLAKIAQNHAKILIHISTEYVFDGSQAVHTEDEPVTPLGVYGQTKAAGEIAAMTAAKMYLLRTTWLIGDGKNFVDTMIGLAHKNIPPTVVADQIGRLTFTRTLVEAIDHLLKHKAVYGIYNVSNDGQPASWAAITRLIFEYMGRSDLIVTNTTTAEYFAGKPGIAPRPLQSTFDLAKIKATGLQLRDWHDDLRQYVQAQANKEV